jgi:hypothetical protein
VSTELNLLLEQQLDCVIETGKVFLVKADAMPAH